MNLDHLTPGARKVADLSDDERVRHIRLDRWIGYTRATQIIAHLDELFDWPKRQRMPNALIIGPTNNGKSMIVEKFRRQHRASRALSSDFESIPVVCVQMPSEPSLQRFYSLLNSVLGAPVLRRARTAELEPLAIKVMRATGARVLIIDELHNILAGTRPSQLEFLNLIRFLGNELRIPIIGVGTRDAYLAIRTDDQLENRFEPILLPLWEEGEELTSLLASFAASLPLRNRSKIDDPEMARYILNRSGGTIGEMSMLLSATAIAAIENGEESLNRRSFLRANYESPIERRRSFERALS